MERLSVFYFFSLTWHYGLKITSFANFILKFFYREISPLFPKKFPNNVRVPNEGNEVKTAFLEQVLEKAREDWPVDGSVQENGLWYAVL